MIIKGSRVRVDWNPEGSSDNIVYGTVITGDELYPYDPLPPLDAEEKNTLYVRWDDGGWLSLSLLTKDLALNGGGIVEVEL